MKICILLLLGYLSLSKAAISQIRRGNSYQHSPVKSNNAYTSKTQTKTNYAASSSGNTDKILHNEMEMKKDGTYHYQYETSNGITAKEEGVGGVSVQGASSYISPEGVEIKMSYTADENGYHPVGDHIPKTPDYILRALEYIRTHPYKEDDNDKYKQNVGNGSAKKAATKLTTHIAPPTHKPAPRKVTPAPRRANSFEANKKFATKNQYHKGKRF